MPTHFYWGNDEYRLVQAVERLRSRVLDAAWVDFNYTKISAATDAEIIDGLTDAMTAPFGNGDRVTWLTECRIAKQCSEGLLQQLAETLPILAENSHLVFTTPDKPDARLKSTKLLQKYAQFTEFSLIPPWDGEGLFKAVQQAVSGFDLPLDEAGIHFLVEAVGNDSRRLQMELAKIKLFMGEALTAPSIAELTVLVAQAGHNTLQLAQAIRSGDADRALVLLQELLLQNEPGVKITITLTSQLRTWLQVKAMQEAGERDDKAIAQFAELANPKRVYFLKKEVQALSVQQLFEGMEILLHLEADLKRGAEEVSALQTAIMRLCDLFCGF